MTTTTKTNRYQGRCIECGDTVPAGAGVLVRAAGRWFPKHPTHNRATGRPIGTTTEAPACPFHAPSDDECRGAEACTASARRNMARVTEANAYEVGRAMGALDRRFHPYIDPTFGNADEICMHAMEAYYDER